MSICAQNMSYVMMNVCDNLNWQKESRNPLRISIIVDLMDMLLNYLSRIEHAAHFSLKDHKFLY